MCKLFHFFIIIILHRILDDKQEVSICPCSLQSRCIVAFDCMCRFRLEVALHNQTFGQQHEVWSRFQLILSENIHTDSDLNTGGHWVAAFLVTNCIFPTAGSPNVIFRLLNWQKLSKSDYKIADNNKIKVCNSFVCI